MGEQFTGLRRQISFPRYLVELFGSRTRCVAVGFLLSPVVVWNPFRYYVFRLAGGWLVSKSLDRDHRTRFLALEFLLIFTAFTVVTEFVGVLLLYIDGYHRKWLIWFIAPLSLAVYPSIAILVFTVDCYFRFN